MHLLLIEDDAPLARALLPLAHWDAVLLDWQLPDGEGLTLLPLLRRQLPDSPVLMLTARDQITDRIRGLDAGADDYLVKPFDPQELLARLRAVERRISGTHSAVLRMPGLEIDLGRHQVLRDGQPVELMDNLGSSCLQLEPLSSRVMRHRGAIHNDRGFPHANAFAHTLGAARIFCRIARRGCGLRRTSRAAAANATNASESRSNPSRGCGREQACILRCCSKFCSKCRRP